MSRRCDLLFPSSPLFATTLWPFLSPESTDDGVWWRRDAGHLGSVLLAVDGLQPGALAGPPLRLALLSVATRQLFMAVALVVARILLSSGS